MVSRWLTEDLPAVIYPHLWVATLNPGCEMGNSKRIGDWGLVGGSVLHSLTDRLACHESISCVSDLP